MAQSKKNTAGKRTSASKKSGSTGRTYQKKTTNNKNTRYTEPMDTAIRNEILLIALLAVVIVLFLCNFGVIGIVGDTISNVMFGIFGLMAYVVPILFFIMIAFGMVNSGNSIATRKLIAGVALFLIIGIVFDLFTGKPGAAESYQIKEIYESCSQERNGGGVLGGSLAYLCCHFLGMTGTILVVLVGAVISVVVITDKSFVTGVRAGSRKVYERTREDAQYRRERAIERRKEQEEERRLRMEQKQLREEEIENEKILRMDKKISGVMIDTSLSKEEDRIDKERDDMHEINLQDFDEKVDQVLPAGISTGKEVFNFSNIRVNGSYINEVEEEEITSDRMSEITGMFDDEEEIPEYEEQTYEEAGEPEMEPVIQPVKPTARVKQSQESKRSSSGAVGTVVTGEMYKEMQDKKAREAAAEYVIPPLNLLKKGKNKSGDSTRALRETAERLRQTLQTFGVKVTITDISQGPSVTRYEMQPEQGVKVSKIVGLTDDIKLNLAATDIRIEAPIPGKAAVGIEVPNKENSAVALRDLLESNEFQKFDSNIAFAVGKDIAGKTVVADIAKMPHMLIAGATGSGKSVCINTLIMSIIYKAHPDDVKLIMVDPKVVELSVYNGIPHLLIPVVTDPKKAASALHWGVAEMDDRYRKFADFNVRDLKGYNKKVEEMKAKGDQSAPAKMPQIVIIVDELADLMMVASGEVEESICRLAQLARAAGIHLIIATQRPSVDVITGLIKANMPSRVAFSVSSSVDSRTILDMNGAEKLLGKGDMLFYPQGYSKPARVQGAFVSDNEVSDVVDFLKNQKLGNIYSEDIQEKIANIGTAGASAGSDGGQDRDEYFVEAGKFIIDKDKASIGMLQRVFKIGFNRAARIMDQLCEAGVVGEEEGTKPRKVLMSLEQFEQYIEECL
ncbi:MAG: DNA translocase FtsK [Lachnospiraceae bacterium]|nr:DNA translocase FtsK [Lachnospiraceae bacterium]